MTSHTVWCATTFMYCHEIITMKGRCHHIYDEQVFGLSESRKWRAATSVLPLRCLSNVSNFQQLSATFVSQVAEGVYDS